jgi:hypothetical protein
MFFASLKPTLGHIKKNKKKVIFFQNKFRALTQLKTGIIKIFFIYSSLFTDGIAQHH